MFSRVSHQPLKQKKVWSETEPLWRLAQVHDIDVPDGAGGSDLQHWPGAAPSSNARLLPNVLHHTFFKRPSWAGGAQEKCPWDSPVTYTYCTPPVGCSVQQCCAWVNGQALVLSILPRRTITVTQGRNRIIFSPAMEEQELTQLSYNLTFKPFGPG